MFGGYSEYMNAPFLTVLRHKLRLIAKWAAEKEISEEYEDKMKG